MSEVQLTPETKAFTITLQYNFAGKNQIREKH